MDQKVGDSVGSGSGVAEEAHHARRMQRQRGSAGSGEFVEGRLAAPGAERVGVEGGNLELSGLTMCRSFTRSAAGVRLDAAPGLCLRGLSGEGAVIIRRRPAKRPSYRGLPLSLPRATTLEAPTDPGRYQEIDAPRE